MLATDIWYVSWSLRHKFLFAKPFRETKVCFSFYIVLLIKAELSLTLAFNASIYLFGLGVFTDSMLTAAGLFIGGRIEYVCETSLLSLCYFGIFLEVLWTLFGLTLLIS